MAASTSTVILFKKEKEPVDEYNNMFKAAGLDVIFIPVLDIIHCNGDELSNALSRPKDFSGIVFTSQSAVTSVAISCTNIDIKCLWDALPVFVVGKATSDCVRSNLRIEPVGECSGNAESLSDFIISNYKLSLVKPLLFPCGNIHKETLPMKLSNEGIKIQPVICYNTVPHPSLSSRLSSM
jgi:uroporphyrinogen-III synthase